MGFPLAIIHFYIILYYIILYYIYTLPLLMCLRWDKNTTLKTKRYYLKATSSVKGADGFVCMPNFLF